MRQPNPGLHHQKPPISIKGNAPGPGQAIRNEAVFPATGRHWRGVRNVGIIGAYLCRSAPLEQLHQQVYQHGYELVHRGGGQQK